MDNDVDLFQAATRHPLPQQDVLRLQHAHRRVDLVGQQLGSYRLVRFLAQGGFAAVYLGEHRYLGTQAAIKVLHAQLAQEEMASFSEEARIVARLRHPHIISVRDFAVQDGAPFLVMDYAPHGTLRQRHPRGEIISPVTISPYLLQIADALQYAHDQQIIHRDVKPENMLIGWRDDILLSDFGIATAMLMPRASTHTSIIGTIAYMSPEQFESSAFPASDQYALGVVAYDWLCGRFPFCGSVAEIAAQHALAAPPALRQFNPHLSSELEQVVLRALAKDPQQRFATIRDFALAFAAACPVDANALRSIETPPLLYTDLHVSGMVPTVYVSHQPAKPQLPTLPKVALIKDAPVYSRRSIMLGMGALAALGTGVGGCAWLLRVLSPASPTPPSIASEPILQQPVPLRGTLLIAPYRGHTGNVNAVSWSTHNAHIIVSGSADHSARVWLSTSGADIRVYSGHTASVNALAWSPDGRIIASASSDNTVQLWSALTSDETAILIYHNHADIVNTVAWSQTRNVLASGSCDGTVRVWHIDGRDITVYTHHTDVVTAVAWSPDGMYVASASQDQTVQVWKPWQALDFTLPIVTFEHHTAAVNAVAWSSDGRFLASAGGDQTVQIWLPLIGGNPVLTYFGHSGSVNAVAWSPDNLYLASGGDDGTVQVWRASDGHRVYTYRGHRGESVRSITWSVDGKSIASASVDQTVQVWSV